MLILHKVNSGLFDLDYQTYNYFEYVNNKNMVAKIY